MHKVERTACLFGEWWLELPFYHDLQLLQGAGCYLDITSNLLASHRGRSPLFFGLWRMTYDWRYQDCTASPASVIRSILDRKVTLLRPESRINLQRLLKFQVPSLMSIFHCLDNTKESIQVKNSVQHCVTLCNILFFWNEELLVPCQTPGARGPPLACCLQLLMW
jgi:hypothetical protein